MRKENTTLIIMGCNDDENRKENDVETDKRRRNRLEGDDKGNMRLGSMQVTPQPNLTCLNVLWPGCDHVFFLAVCLFVLWKRL